jgi:hypothetical protein
MSAKAGYKYSVFDECKNLSAITLAEGIQAIGNDWFYLLSGLTSVKIPNSVTHIGEEVFMNCTNLSSIYIPASVTIIEKDISLGCYKDCIVFAEAQSKPAGWDAKWNNDKKNIAWGYTPGAVLIKFSAQGGPKISATIDGKEVISPVALARGKSIVFTAIADWGVRKWTLNGETVNGTNKTYTYTNRSETETPTVEVTVS